MALATLGLFVFEVTAAPFDRVARETGQRWGNTDRAGAAPAYQYLGAGPDTLTLDGTLYPELTGGPVHLDTLREMAAGGKAWILLDGRGTHRGQWVITRVRETRAALDNTGLARKIGFTLELTRYPDEDTGDLGDLADSAPHAASWWSR